MMEDAEDGLPDGQLSLFSEASLLGRLAEQQGQLVSRLLEQAARSEEVSEQNTRLITDLAGSRDRLQEVHHRIRNHLQTVTGLLSAQETSEQSPSARRALHKGIARLASIAAIHDLLARDPTSGDLRLPELAEQLARHLLSHAAAEGRVRIHTEVAPLTLAPKEATAFVLILTELLSNAIEHAFPREATGEVFVRLERVGSQAVLELRDTGRGLPPGFDPTHSERLGLRLVWRLVERDLEGSITADTADGVRFRVTFPVR
jgi:two-component sensor histidine kinase